MVDPLNVPGTSSSIVPVSHMMAYYYPVYVTGWVSQDLIPPIPLLSWLIAPVTDHQYSPPYTQKLAGRKWELYGMIPTSGKDITNSNSGEWWQQSEQELIQHSPSLMEVISHWWKDGPRQRLLSHIGPYWPLAEPYPCLIHYLVLNNCVHTILLTLITP